MSSCNPISSLPRIRPVSRSMRWNCFFTTSCIRSGNSGFFDSHFRGKALKPLDLFKHLRSIFPCWVARRFANTWTGGSGETGSSTAMAPTGARSAGKSFREQRLPAACVVGGRPAKGRSSAGIIWSTARSARAFLVRPVQEALVFHDRYHHLITHKNARNRPEYIQFREWIGEEVDEMMKEWPKGEVGGDR